MRHRGRGKRDTDSIGGREIQTVVEERWRDIDSIGGIQTNKGEKEVEIGI